MSLREQLTEIKDWFGTYSGKLAAAAAVIGTPLANNAVTALGLATFIPEGWPRALLLVAIALATFLAPKAAAKKDAANGG